MLQGLAQVGKRGRLIVQKRLCTGQKHKIVGWLAIGNRGFYQSQQAIAQSAGLLLPAGRFKACGVAQAQPGIGYATVDIAEQFRAFVGLTSQYLQNSWTLAGSLQRAHLRAKRQKIMIFERTPRRFREKLSWIRYCLENRLHNRESYFQGEFCIF